MASNRSLRDAVQRALSRSGEPSDSGAALVMTLGIMMVGATILTTLAVVTMFSTENTARTRIEMRALASADAGIDLYLDMLEGATYEELSGVCSTSGLVINNDTVDVKTVYEVTRGGVDQTVACPSTTDVTRKLTIYSTATTSAAPLSGNVYTKTVAATLVPTPPEITLDKAIFSEGSTTITNDSDLLPSGAVDEFGNPIADAHVYSNGGVTCLTNVGAQGSIYAAHGNIDLQNGCRIGNGVWASGYIRMSSNAFVDGNAYAASNAPEWGISLQNTATINGTALTNGGIYVEGKYADGDGILGTAFARTGKITLAQQAWIAGSAYANGNIQLTNGARIGYDAISTTGSITTSNNGNRIEGHARAAGTIEANATRLYAASKTPGVSVSIPGVPNPAEVFPGSVGYPANIQPPAREPMPQIYMNTEDIALWEAQGYTVEMYSPATYPSACSGNGPQSILNDNAGKGPRLIIFEGCSGPVTFTNHSAIHLTASVALVSDTGFRTENSFNLTTNSTGDRYQMHWIVPADAPGVSWSPAGSGQYAPSCTSPAGDLYFGNAVTINSVETLAYTPCLFYQQNTWSTPWIGQIYAGNVSTQNNFLMQMTSVPVPSLADGEPEPDSPTDMRVLSRYDVHG